MSTLALPTWARRPQGIATKPPNVTTKGKNALAMNTELPDSVVRSSQKVRKNAKITSLAEK